MMISNAELDRLSSLLRPRSLTVRFEGVAITTKPVSPPVRFTPLSRVGHDEPKLATVREVTRTHLLLAVPAAIPAAGTWIIAFDDWTAPGSPGNRFQCRVESACRESNLVKIVTLAWIAEDTEVDLAGALPDIAGRIDGGGDAHWGRRCA